MMRQFKAQRAKKKNKRRANSGCIGRGNATDQYIYILSFFLSFSEIEEVRSSFFFPRNGKVKKQQKNKHEKRKTTR